MRMNVQDFFHSFVLRICSKFKSHQCRALSCCRILFDFCQTSHHGGLPDPSKKDKKFILPTTYRLVRESNLKSVSFVPVIWFLILWLWIERTVWATIWYCFTVAFNCIISFTRQSGKEVINQIFQILFSLNWALRIRFLLEVFLAYRSPAMLFYSSVKLCYWANLPPSPL